MSYTSRPLQDVRTLVSALSLSDVTGDPSEYAPWLVHEETRRSLDPGSLDQATFRYDLAQTGEKVRHLRTPLEFSRSVEVRLYTGAEVAPGVPEFKPLFWGILTEQNVVCDEDVEVTVTAAIFPYLLGGVCKGPRFYDPYGAEGERYVDVWEKLDFNPLSDGLIEPSMAVATHDPGSAPPYRLFADPDSYQTTGAEAIQDQHGEGGRESWTLGEAIYSLCWMCNPDEAWVRNPGRDELLAVTSSAPAISNVQLPYGKHLTFYLDNLLSPAGFAWEVALSQDPDEPSLTRRQIRVVSLSSGPEKTVAMQDYGEAIELDPTADTFTNCAGFTVRTEIGNVANEVTAVGARKEREYTFPLFRTWPVEDDALTWTDLRISKADSKYHTENKTNVWRQWVACEGGDYTDFDDADDVLRASPAITDSYVAEGLWKVARNQKLAHRLVLYATGKRRPWLVEYSVDGGGTWKQVPWACYLAATHIGINFLYEDSPPAELMAAGDNARLRITGTVVDDVRLEGFAPYSPDSPNGIVSGLVIDATDRAFFREVDSGVTVPTGADVQTRDDTALVESIAEHARDAAKAAAVTAEFRMFGVTGDYQLGDVLTKVEFREIDLNRHAPEADTDRYLMVTRIIHRSITETVLIATPQQPPAYFFRKGKAGDRYLG